jgi:hypothetical protein
VCFCVLYIKPEAGAFGAKNIKISLLNASKLQTIFPTFLASLIFLAFLRLAGLIINDLWTELVDYSLLISVFLT